MLIAVTILGLSLLILVHEFGHFIAAKFFSIKVEEFGFGFPPCVFSWKRGETVYSMNAVPIGGFVRLEGEYDAVGKEIAASPHSFSARPAWQRAIVMLAGVLMNVMCGWVILTGVFMAGIPQHLVIARVVEDSPAQRAHLEEGDVILGARFNGKELSDPIASDAFTALARSAAGSELFLSVGRAGETLRVGVVGREVPPPGEGALGVGLAEIGAAPLPFFGAFQQAFVETVELIRMVGVGFVALIRQVITEPAALEGIAGPVGVVAFAAHAGSLGFVYLIQFVAFISLNLAVFNIIPFPALDGGRLVMLCFEYAKGSPFSRRLQVVLNAFGFVLLIGIVIAVTIQDIGRLAG